MSEDTQTETTEAPAEEAKAKRKRDDLPEGSVTPVGFANYLNSPEGRNLKAEDPKGVGVRPQMIYGYERNNNAGFRDAVGVVQHTDGRKIFSLEAGLAWWDAKEQRKTDRAAKAAEKAAAPAESTEAE